MPTLTELQLLAGAQLLTPLIEPRINELLCVTDANAPTAALFVTAGLLLARAPSRVLLLPVGFDALKSAEYPTKVLFTPERFSEPDDTPKKALLPPRVFFLPAKLPKNALLLPCVF